MPGIFLQGAVAAVGDEKTAVPPASESSEPVEITADRTSYDKETETLEADGSVVIVQGPVRLTADHAILELLTGNVTATGQVYLVKQTSELWAERLQLNLNTEMGVVTNGRLFTKETNTTVIARQIQRFSEDHYRAKEGSFTNCDVMEGKTPAWRFRFEDVDLEQGDSVYMRKVWFCVNDVPVIPFPTFR
ncbi:MAG: LptA/OstA family protein, partial [Nitrospiraceae bacterium]